MFGRARDHSDAANVLTIKPFDISDDDNRKKNSLQISFFRSLFGLRAVLDLYCYSAVVAR